jgi:hypothetical protein
MRLKFLVVLMICLSRESGLVLADANSSNSWGKISSSIEHIRSLPGTIGNIKSPELQNPDWLQSEIDTELASQRASVADRLATYDVTTKGSVTADFAEFKSQANQTLNDARGWSSMGVRFQEVASGGDFTLVLSEASQVPSFYPSVCSSDWSCQIGRYVIINQDRWLGASDSWNQSGGSLRDYRNMVIDHETGHWLGHSDDNGHCGGSGQLAPIMQQQSIDLLGCSFNAWPIDSELWSSRLGINI